VKRTFTVLLLQACLCGLSLAQTPGGIPCRIHDRGAQDLFVLTLGDVHTPLAEGVFDPAADRVTLATGRVIDHYYRDSLGVKYYTPIDKKVFPLPPTGWCSWYYYYQEVNEKDIMQNARWLADNLKDYGFHYIQIDDGWQGAGHGSGENRDWTVVNRRFPTGMDKLATYIKSLGFKAGIWLAPHGQSSDMVVKANPQVFLLTPDGTSASDTWEGKYLVDPTAPGSGAYLKQLFSVLAGWGYDYFKIDGQPIVVREYRAKRQFMKDSTQDPDASYRSTLEAIRAAIGPERYLLGCWGIPLEGTGPMIGSRTGGDVLPGWAGFETALDATMRYTYLHNIVWYNDPDCLLLRLPLTLDQARTWATLAGLTGQALMAGDRMMDLPNERLEILKRVAPAEDIRPLDLFPAQGKKHVWDLKIRHLGRSYDVVGLFNFDREKTQQLYLSWKEIGLAGSGPVHVFDFWNEEYLGAWEKGIALAVPPTGTRVITLMPQGDGIQLISTNRHITQGWVDLRALSKSANVWKGTSTVVAGDTYELRFVFPQTNNFVVASATADTLPVVIRQHQGWATVAFTSGVTRDVDWQVMFSPSEYYFYSVQAPAGVAVKLRGLDGVDVTWADQYYLTAGYRVSLDGALMGYTPTSRFPLGGIDVKTPHTVSVRTAWLDGSESARADSLTFTLAGLLPDAAALSEVEPVRASAGWGEVERNMSVTGKMLSLGGKKFTSGIGTHAVSEIEYRVNAAYRKFSAVVGIDDASEGERGSVEFIVLGDGHELWRSGIMKKSHGAKEVSCDIRNVRELVLRVTDAGDGIDYDHADWAEARVSGLQ
jgi:hypothetical protein